MNKRYVVTGIGRLGAFRFLHAADVHLDSPLKGLSGQEGSAAERIRTATRGAFDRLVGHAVDERVAFLVIAGDLYDGDWRDYRTGLFFVSRMGRLRAAGVPVYLLFGNHDAQSRITRRLTLPDNVHVFGSARPESFEVEGPGAVLHGQSFRQRDVADNLAAAYPAPVPGAFNIGVLHTGLGGLGGHENYAPCTLADLVNKGYDYWALGHVHQAQVLAERPHVVFPGNLQGRHVREAGPKGACLVSVEDGEVTGVETLPCDVVRWAVVAVDLARIGSVAEAEDRIREAIESAAADRADGRLLACRVHLQGRTEVHDALLAADDRLLAEARSNALGLGDDAAWIEKIVVATEPEIDPRTLAEREDAIGELLRMLPEADGDPRLLQPLRDDVGELIRRLPHEVRSEVEDAVLKAAVDGDYAGMIAEVTPWLSARLAAGEG